MTISYKNLDVYKAATKFLAISIELTGKIPRGHGSLVDQLRRASLSIPLNIAEASGKNSRADGARLFSIARGSAMECSAILDALAIMKLGDEIKIQEGTTILERIVAMLSKLCR